MSPVIMVGVVALLVALVFYSLGTWMGFRKRAVSARTVVFLWVGFIFDSLATLMMAIENGGIAQDLHTLVAFIAMAGMLVAAAFGTAALKKGDASLSGTVARWTAVPWAAWVAMFFWALAQRRG